MTFFATQNPGIGGLDEITDSEALLLQNINSLGDPNADRILFWDDSAGQFQYLTIGSGLSIVGTTISATAGSLDGSGIANEISYWVDSNTLGSLGTATYPSLTELSYVKGVTSAIQTQISTKEDVANKATTMSGNTASDTKYLSAKAVYDWGVATFAALAGSISQAFGVSQLEIGHATDTTITRTGAGAIAVEGVGVALNSTSLPHTASQYEIGHASDTSLTRVSAGVAAIEGKNIALNGTGEALTTGTIELGHASDTTLSRSAAGVLAVEGVVVPTISSTNTISNKRYTPRVYTASNNASLTPEIDTYDIFHLTAMSAATTINNHSTSTPADGELMEIRFLDNGTARALTWGSAYVAKAGVALPTTTVLSKNLVCLFEYNSNLSKWVLLASGQEA